MTQENLEFFRKYDRFTTSMAHTVLPPELAKIVAALANAFAQSQTVVSARARIGLFYQDAAATELFRKVSEYGTQLQEKSAAGMPPGEEEIAKFDKLRNDVVNNTQCKGFLEAREKLDLMLATVNQYLCLAIDKGAAPSDEEVAESMTRSVSACSCGGHCKDGECNGNCDGHCHDGHDCHCHKHEA